MDKAAKEFKADTKQDKDNNKTTWLDIVGTIGVLLVIVFGISFITGVFSGSKAEQELADYRDAETVCGHDNVWEHSYTNGTTDFSCRDYDRVGNASSTQ